MHIFETLARMTTYACGTLRINRTELPKNLMQKGHKDMKKKGDSIFSKCGNLLLTLWQDKKIIRVLSTFHGTEMSKTTRNLKDTEGKFSRAEIPYPQSVKDYSKYMGGVDLADQMFSYYSFGRKSRKWTTKLFFFALEVMKLNSYIMFNSLVEKKVSFFEFSIGLVHEILEQTKDVPVPRPLPSEPNARLTTRCLPSSLGRKSWCRVCYRRYGNHPTVTRKQTKYGCKDCSVHLCLPHCFAIYHTVSKYETYIEPAPNTEE